MDQHQLHPGDQNRGIGGQPVVDPRTGGQDLRLMRRAILNGWNVPEHVKQLVVEEMARLARLSHRLDSNRG
jgi:hypothetical protein